MLRRLLPPPLPLTVPLSSILTGLVILTGGKDAFYGLEQIKAGSLSDYMKRWKETSPSRDLNVKGLLLPLILHLRGKFRFLAVKKVALEKFKPDFEGMIVNEISLMESKRMGGRLVYKKLYGAKLI